MRAFFDDHKKEEWLQERYSPAIRYRHEQQKKAKKVAEAKSFGDRVRNGTAKICLDEVNDLTGQDFDNDMEDSNRTRYIRRIPCACPISTLSDSIKKAVRRLSLFAVFEGPNQQLIFFWGVLLSL